MNSSITDLCFSFEKNLKWKLNQKAKSSADVFKLLMNIFRYYDPNNSDEINKEQWIKAIKNIGVYLSEEKLNNLFQYYANQNNNINNGMEVINYKDFVYNLLYNSINQHILFKRSNIFVSNNNSIKNINYSYDFKTKKNRDYLEEKNIYNYRINVNINNDPNLKLNNETEENKINNNLFPNNNTYNIKNIKIKNNDFNAINIKYFIKNIIDIFRAKINKDNGVTYYNLLKNIKLHTSFNQNTNISLSKLNFILRESNLIFTTKELQSLFCIIDFNDTGFISINKFLKAIRGNLNYFRTKILNNIFKTQIDMNKTGQISIYYFKRLYQAKNHPDVINKKMTQNEVMTQFNYTFDIFCKLNKINKDINCSQFIEYYEGISPSIPNDFHFKEIINNVWIRTNDFEQTYFPTINNQNINFNLEKKIIRSISSPLMAFNNNNNKFNTLGNQMRNNYHINPDNNNYYNNLSNNKFLNYKNGSLYNSINNNRISLKKVNLTPINNIPKINNSFYQFNNSNLNKSTNISSFHNKYSPIKNNHSQIICHDTISEEANKDKYNYSQIILNSLRNILIKRGNKSIFYLQRMLTNCDNEHTGNISFSDLNNIFRAYNFNIYFYDIKILFDLFDKNKVGVIQYDNLIKSIVGNMNEKRKELVIKIYQDLLEDGYVNIKKMKCRFNSYKHPEVIKGNKTHEEAYGDFLECIQIYKEYMCNINKNNNDFFNLNEFFQFFNEISMYIEDDSDFDLLIFGCWDIK